MTLLLVAAAALASLLLTWVLRRYALARSFIDIPNERSSHSTPTPRGGGAAIVIVFLSGLILFKAVGNLPAFLFWALFGAGAWTALIGWLDDRGNIPAGIRLVGHFMGASWALYCTGGLPELMFFGFQTDLGWIGHILAVFCLVWLLNLYNFMDGIDGIAGIEALTVCTGGLVLWALSPADEALWMVPLLLASAVSGFLFWNFPLARIFMGDAGSGFLGLALGIVCLQAGNAAPELFWGWLILLGAFVVDATVTLLRRALRGKKIHQAHRTHAYQHAVRKYGTHWQVSLAYGAINLLWLLPMAALVVSGLVAGTAGLILAYAPLVGAAYWFGAGTQD